MTCAMHRLADQAHPAFPLTIYYAFKQAETDDRKGTASTGWDTFLDAVMRAGFSIIKGTWPIRSEQEYRLRGMESRPGHRVPPWCAKGDQPRQLRVAHAACSWAS